MKIFDLEIGESAKITGVGENETMDILESMGIFVGQKIKIIFKSSAVIMNINFRTISMSKKLARDIYVSM